MFEGFTVSDVETRGPVIRLVRGALSGPPLLLRHGYPQIHALWHKVAPTLSELFTRVATDLGGYGGSAKPPTDARHVPWSKRAMAEDQVEVMAALGFEEFFVTTGAAWAVKSIAPCWRSEEGRPDGTHLRRAFRLAPPGSEGQRRGAPLRPLSARGGPGRDL